MINGTKIICFSGSTRFTNEMLMWTWECAKRGIIALGWCVLPSNHKANGSEIDHHLAEKEGVAEILDELHLRKIDLSDEVWVVNVHGYIGEGTNREIKYAQAHNKPVRYIYPYGDDGGIRL
jgi:hypothetical protein